MRILGFNRIWEKLHQTEFTTFRFPRRDRDWQVGETVQIVYHPRSKDRQLLGTAIILSKELKWADSLTNQEAVEDGFPGGEIEMWNWLWKFYGEQLALKKLNKLTLRWTYRLDN